MDEDPAAAVSRMLENPGLDPELRQSLEFTLRELKRKPADPPAARAEVPEPVAVEPVVAPPPERRMIAGKSLRRSPWESFQVTGREGVIAGAILAGFLLFATTFLASIHSSVSPKAWSAAVFVVLQITVAALHFGARFLNRHRLFDDVEKAGLWAATALAPATAFSAAIVIVHSIPLGIPAAALATAAGVLAHLRLSRLQNEGRSPGALALVASLIGAAALAPLGSATPGLTAAVVGAILWLAQGRAGSGWSSLLPAAFSLAAAAALTRGAVRLDAPVAPIWGVWLGSFALVSRRLLEGLAGAAAADGVRSRLARFLDAGILGALLLGTSLTVGDPFGTLAAGTVTGLVFLRASLRQDRPLLLLPALGLLVLVHAYLPGPTASGVETFRSGVIEILRARTGVGAWCANGLWFLPCAIGTLFAHAWLIRRDRPRHARIVGLFAAPLAAFTFGSLLLGCTGHPSIGAAIVVQSACAIACGAIASRPSPTLAGIGGVLVGCAAAGFAAGLALPAIELLLLVAILSAVLVAGATQRTRTEFTDTCARRIVDAASLALLFALFVVPSTYSFRLPSAPAPIAVEALLGVTLHVLGIAWRRPEAFLLTAILLARSALGALAEYLPALPANQVAQAMAAVSLAPAALSALHRLAPIRRRPDLSPFPGTLESLAAVAIVYAFTAANVVTDLDWRAAAPAELSITGASLALPFVIAPLAAWMQERRAEPRWRSA